MALKYGSLFFYSETPLERTWVHSVVSVNNEGKLKISTCNSKEGSKKWNTYFLSPAWLVLAPRLPSICQDCPPLPKNKHHTELFGLIKPPEINLWFLACSKYERDQWVQKILPLITLRPDFLSETCVSNSSKEYDNWAASDKSYENAFTPIKTQPISLPYPTHRMGFYSIQKEEKTKKNPDKEEAPLSESKSTPINIHSDATSTLQTCCPAWLVFTQNISEFCVYCCSCCTSLY